jgi:prenyltransferase beta subunit
MIYEFMTEKAGKLGFDTKSHPLWNFRSHIILEEEPLTFRNHDALMDYILQDGYQTDKDKPGICFGV